MRPAWQHCESDEGDPAFEIERETKIAVGEEPCVLCKMFINNRKSQNPPSL